MPRPQRRRIRSRAGPEQDRSRPRQGRPGRRDGRGGWRIRSRAGPGAGQEQVHVGGSRGTRRRRPGDGPWDGPRRFPAGGGSGAGQGRPGAGQARPEQAGRGRTGQAGLEMVEVREGPLTGRSYGRQGLHAGGACDWRILRVSLRKVGPRGNAFGLPWISPWLARGDPDGLDQVRGPSVRVPSPVGGGSEWMASMST